MRHEWKGRDGILYVERGEDGIIDTNAGPDDLEAHEEILRLTATLAESEAQRRFEADLFQKGPQALEGVITEREQEIRLLRRERRLLVDLDIAKSNIIDGLLRSEVRKSLLAEVERLQGGILALHAEARGGILLPEGVACQCLLCAPKRDLKPVDNKAGLLHGDPESMDEVTARRQAEHEEEN